MPEGDRPDPPNGTLRVACSGLYPPTHWTNVFHLKITSTGEPDLDDIDSVLDAVNTAYVTNLLPVLSTNVEYQGCEGVYFGASGPIRLTADSTGSGAVSDAVALPANVAVGISWKIAASYRGGHPRTYLVGIDSDQIADVQRLTPAAQLLYQAAASAFRGDMQTIAPGAPIT
ncbi:MAG TPA: hypothetical protein VIQ02_02860, partial [Jiangellaceae bacterium]